MSDICNVRVYACVTNASYAKNCIVVMKEFLSSCLLIVSWFIFTVSAYLLYWIIIMPTLAIIPFLISLISGLLCFHFSRKIDNRREK